jgi:hypothetical protein
VDVIQKFCVDLPGKHSSHYLLVFLIDRQRRGAERGTGLLGVIYIRDVDQDRLASQRNEICDLVSDSLVLEGFDHFVAAPHELAHPPPKAVNFALSHSTYRHIQHVSPPNQRVIPATGFDLNNRSRSKGSGDIPEL